MEGIERGGDMAGIRSILSVFTASLLTLGALPAPVRAEGFADPAFQATWERTDKLVADGTVKRSFYWGPAPGVVQNEAYAEGAGGKRLVQYFDKSRMEINKPNGDRNDPFFVTNGLLTVELITGRMQVGDKSYVDRYAAQIPLASDTDDANAPTYATFGKLMGKAENRVGTAQVSRVDREGNVTMPRGKLPTEQDRIAYYEPQTGHNIPNVFWDFLNQSGPVWQGGKVVTARLSDPWFYATGLPITEPYWAFVKIGGKQDVEVYIQAYERRVLTYVPSAPEGFQVQMGNIGQHYYDWRYKGAGKGSGGGSSTPAATVGTSPGKLSVGGDVKTPLSLDVAGMAARNPQSVQVSFQSPAEAHTYKGPLLLDVAKEAGGDGNAGRDLLTRVVIATGQDGKKVAVSWGEMDPIFAGRKVILGYEQDGKALGGEQGPARLVVPSDKSGVRSIYGLSEVRVSAVQTTTTSGTALHIGGLVNKPLTLTAGDLAARNSVEETVSYMAGGQSGTYTYRGVPLWALLNEAGVQGGAGTASNLDKYVLVAGNDGRNAVVSWGEIDPALSGVDVLLAYEQDGVPLGGGLARLVVPSDARGGRYIPYVTSIELRAAVQ
jgi:DMSO/TMAO reductase YedYZ molybdopterin-dependent catalytic subunit